LGIRKARARGARRLVIYIDFELITNQIGKTYKAKHDEMAKYLRIVRAMEKYFGFFVKKIPKEQNKEADMLAKAATQKEPYHQMCSMKFSSTSQLTMMKDLSRTD
jgi:ribonuclease HI